MVDVTSPGDADGRFCGVDLSSRPDVSVVATVDAARRSPAVFLSLARGVPVEAWQARIADALDRLAASGALAPAAPPPSVADAPPSPVATLNRRQRRADAAIARRGRPSVADRDRPTLLDAPASPAATNPQAPLQP